MIAILFIILEYGRTVAIRVDSKNIRLRASGPRNFALETYRCFIPSDTYVPIRLPKSHTWRHSGHVA